MHALNTAPNAQIASGPCTLLRFDQGEMDKHVKRHDISLAEAIAFVLNFTLALCYVGSTKCAIAVRGAQNLVYLWNNICTWGEGAGRGENPLNLKLKLSRKHRTHQVMFCKSGMSPVTITS